ncbi:hypothetical protein [Kitasatospora sp. NPDC006786]|uniref:hypothetical protein n=1 Tax=unclassified Kitasatospora TaxID=2633591 RepID=UPI00340C8F60
MFVIEGLPCVFLAFVVLKYLPDGPATAPWPTAKEAALVSEAVTREQDGAKAAGTSCGSLLTVLRDKQMPIAIFANWTHQVALYSVVHFLPGITGGFVGSYDMGWAEESTGNHLAGLWISVVLLALGARRPPPACGSRPRTNGATRADRFPGPADRPGNRPRSRSRRGHGRQVAPAPTPRTGTPGDGRAEAHTSPEARR